MNKTLRTIGFAGAVTAVAVVVPLLSGSEGGVTKPVGFGDSEATPRSGQLEGSPTFGWPPER